MTEQVIEILESMLARVEKCESINKLLLDNNKTLINSNKVLSEALEALRNEYENYTENSIYEILDPRTEHHIRFYPKVRSIDETLDDLLSGQRSLCRFGDGEFACISGNLRAKFTTKYYPELAGRLAEVLHSNDDSIMVAIADNYGDLSMYSPQSRREIRSYMTSEIRREHAQILNRDSVYYNAYVTRPYMFYYDDENKMQDYWKRIKSLWEKRHVMIIEGQSTGMGAGNDLLANASKVSRIIAPAVNAYEEYDSIWEAAMEQPLDCLYLIALGPVATVLAYDLARSGRQAIDIGHLDIEYEWMKRGAYRSIIPNKYVNEVDGGTSPGPICDPVYLNQILRRI